MAYRQPGERRDRSGEMAATSYLENFLEQISNLPTTAQEALDQIRTLDDKVTSQAAEAEASAAATIYRTTIKGIPVENARRSYEQCIQFQKSALEAADKKVALASSAHEALDSIICDIDRRLIEFEAQLRNDGRWPGAPGKKPVTPRNLPSKGNPDRPAVAKAPRSAAVSDTAVKSLSNAPPSSTRGAQRSRGRDSGPSSKARATTGRASAATARSSQSKANKALVATPEDTDVIMEEATASATDATDSAGIDTKIYCTCRKVSHGEMIGCEDENCAIEWFHFECVGLTEAPEGAWFCDDCTEKMRRKSSSSRRKLTT